MLTETVLPVTPSAPARRGLIALGFIVSLLGLGIGAWLTASSSVLLAVFEACCLCALGVVVLLEVRPAIVDLGGGAREIRRFRHQLEARPETTHPLGA